MFTVSVETSFRASHRLTLQDGSQEPRHFHDWIVSADVSSEKVNDMGVVIDFHQLKATIDSVIAEFDNLPLERIDYFKRNNPSAENVAKYIYESFESKLPRSVKLKSITVFEKKGCSAKYENYS